MKKIKIFTIIAMAFLMLFCISGNTNIAHAVNKEIQNPASYDISADYAFRIRYTGDTNMQVYPNYGYSLDANNHWRLDSAYWSKGNVWARYNNVGIYNGRPIDIKVVYVDWNNPLRLSFDTTGIGGGYAKWTENNFNAGKYLDIRVEFYYHDTGEAAYIKGHEIVYDLDYFERWEARSNITKIIKDSNQSYSDIDANTIGIGIGGTGAIDGGSFAFLYEGTSYTYRWRGCYYQMGLQPLFKIAVPNPTKAVSTATAGIGNTIKYTITDWVPSESPEYYYNNWVINDTIPASLSWGTGDVWVTNEYGTNVTGNFSISKAGNTLSVRSNIVSSAGFYGHYYTIHINTRVTTGSLGNYTSGNGTILSNSASLTTNRGVNNSNSVSTEVKYNISTSIDHGSITGTISNAKGGSSQTVSFTPTRGYYINRIVVDGVDQPVNNLKSGSYTFNNLLDNHSVQVYCLPMRMRIQLSKTDAETGKTAQGDATLAGAKYGIYSDSGCTKLVETLTLDGNANATSSDLPLVEYVNGNYVYHETYYIKETQAPTGYNLDTAVHQVKQDAGAQTVKVSVHNEAKYTDTVIKNDIEITKFLEKTDSTLKQNLAGVVFKATLKSDSSKVYYSTETNAAGYCKISNLPYGTYTVTEMKIPGTAFGGNFYIGNSTNRVIMFDQFIGQDKSKASTYVYKDITNAAKKMQITVVKEDKETGKTTQGDAHLEGAQYTIYRDQACTNAIETLTIAKQADGTYSAKSGWYLVGTYYVKETKAPVGYLIDQTVYTVKQDSTAQTAEHSSHTIVSKDEVIRNDIEITKYIEATDSTEKQSLAGAVFSATLKSDPSKVYYSSATNANGYCIIKELPYGVYTIRETTLPATAYNKEFYVGNSTTRVTTFEQFIQVDNSTNAPYVWSDITDVAEKMQITIFKEDIETGTTTQGDAHLEGAEYTLYKDRDCRNAIETITIAKNPDGTYSAKSGWYLVGTYYVKETKAPEGYLIDETVYTVAQDPAAQTSEHTSHTIVSKDEVIRNDIEITKNLEATDSTEKQSLAGAVFSATLNSDTSKVYYSSVTDENGYCIITELPYGTYTLRESTLPDVAYNREFYVGDSTTRVTTFEQFIEVDNSTNDPYVWGDITDVAEKMQITIFKEDIETGIITQGDAHLENAEYTLYRDEACTDPIETLTIAKNPDGTYSATSSWYLVGTYYIKETKVSEGYLIDETVYKVEQDPAAQTAEHSYHSITSKNEVIRNDIEVVKNLEATDSTEKQSLPGAVFSATLNSDTSKVYYSSVTDENGYCIITELPYGTYTLRESTLPDVAYNREFYIDDDTTRSTTFEQFVEVDNSTNDPYVWGDITDVAEKMQITIYKEDLEKGNNLQGDATLEGAEYTLYRDEACTDAIETITIEKDDEGRFSAKSGWYLVGTYWMKETKAPEGYLIDEEVYKVVQDPAAQTEEHSYHSITSKDQVMKGLVQVIKYNNNSQSSDKIPAEGATLMLYLNSNPNKYYLATVDENGYAEFIDEDYRDSQYPYTIPYGRYTIAEVKPSNTGKHIFINKQQTSIEYHHHTQKYVLDDEFVTLRLTIEKYDAETNKKLAAGATFKIWDANANCWYSEMVYPSGEFISEFTTNDKGQLTINRHLESGAYVLYEVNAPEGYVLDEEGYPFFIGVGENGEVVADHNGEQKTLDYETIKYDNIPTKMYKYTVEYKNIPQKAVVEVTKLASQPVRSEKSETEYGDLYTPIFEDKGLEGVTFRLVAAEDVTTPEGTVRYTKDQIVSTFKTNSEGVGTSDKVYLGKYILEEISTVNGYVLDRTPVDVNIEYTTQDEEVQTIKVEKINEKQKVNVLFKKDFVELEQSRFKFEDRTAIFGIYADYDLIDENGEYIVLADELVDIVEIDQDGIFENSVELPEGEYYIKELYVSNPYGKLTDKFEFKVEYTNTNDKTIDVLINDGVIENEANTAVLGMFKFSDLDYINLGIENITDVEEIKELASMYGVAGATYKVYNDADCTDPVITIDDTEAEFTTDENGTIYIEDMPWGTYYFKESVSPFGYELNEEVIKVEINEGNADNVIVKKISDRLVRAELLEKRDTFTKDVIEGCVFEITDEEENVIYTGVTDERGIVEIPVIYFENEGTYYYKEISAPDMYQVNEEKQEFIASYDEETCEWTLELIEVGNDRKTIDEFILVKTDRETGEPLEGCKFTIVLLDSEGNEYVNEYGETIYLVQDAVTAENGEYVIKDVPYGTYKFVEITPPEGYELDEDITGYTFTIDENSGDTVIYEVTNTGDIAVYAMVGILGISLLGIMYVMSKRRKVNN